MAWKLPFTAASRSASGRMMFGDLPPSSSVTRLSAAPALAPISRPTTVEPVKAILSTSGWPTIAAPVSPSPVSTLSTPSGNPAPSASPPRRMAVRGPRAVHVLRARVRHDRDRLARGRVEALERAPVGRAHALSADEQVVMGVLEKVPGGVGELLGRGGDGHGAMLLGSVRAPGRS